MSEQVTLPEAPFSANTRFVDRDGYDWQLTIRAASLGELIGHIADAKAKVLKNYQPAGAKMATAGSNEANGNAPMCPTHNKPMKPSQHGGFYCPVKIADDDGTGKAVYCKQTIK